MKTKYVECSTRVATKVVATLVATGIALRGGCHVGGHKSARHNP